MAAMKAEKLSMKDGTSMEVMKSENMSEAQWMDYKYYMESNPEEARELEAYSSDPDAMRRQMLLQAISDQWQKQINSGDDEFSKKIKTLEEDPDFEQMFADVKNYAGEQVAEYYQDDGVMMKISRKMGGVPREVKPTLEKIRKAPITLQEACKFGDIKQLQKYISETENHKELREIDAKDHKGITMLGYAIGANRTKIVELLLANGADPNVVDDKGNNGIHYAAAYGRKELVELLMTKKVKIDEPNNDGKTPLALAKQNKMAATKELLLKSGATALPETPPPEAAEAVDRDGE